MPTDFENSAADGNPDEARRESRDNARFAAAVMFVIMMAFVMIPSCTAHFQCPEEAVFSGRLGRGGYSLALVMFGVVFGYIAFAVRAKLRTVLGAASALSLAVGLALWVQASYSYYCATPRAISLHPALGASSNLGWGDVRTVIPYCGYPRRGRGQLYGSNRAPFSYFEFALSDGHRMIVRPWPKETLEDLDHLIATMLRGVSYSYDASNIARCPAYWRSLLSERPR